MSLGPGTRLGPYEIQSAIGAGGMGEVHRARDARLQRDVAIKVLPAGFSSDPDRLARFEQEARAAAALNHPNILAVYDIGSHDGAPYIVSELLDGQTLRERLGSGPLPVRKALEYAIQVARGLAAAHEKGIVHRDLKPDNVFVTTDGRVKILDFGLAKLTEREPVGAAVSALPTTPPVTVAGMVLGTVGYMAPEQVRGLAADARTDIFAFGALLYEMLSGRRAFGGGTTIDVMTAILKEDPADLPAAERSMPPALLRIIDRCLEKSPGARFQTATDLAFALEGVSTHSGTAPVVAIDDVRIVSVLWSRRAAMLWAAAAVVLLLATIALAIGYVSRAPSVPAAVQFTIDQPAGATFAGFPAYAPGAAVSPDGHHVVFMATRTGASTNLLWVRSLDAVEARPLTGTDAATFPFWSHDSKSIAFFAQGKLRKVDVSGGPPQTICDAPAGEGGTWNRDGAIVFAPNPNGALARVSSAGGQPTAVTKLSAADKETSHRWPDFLPDGRHFLFLSLPGNVVHVGSLDSADVTRVVTADSRAAYARGYLFFVRELTLVAQPFDAGRLETTGDAVPIVEDVSVNPNNGRAAFAASESGVLAYRTGTGALDRSLRWFDRTGKELSVLGQPGRYDDVELSPDGRQVSVSAIDSKASRRDIWTFDVARNLRTRFTFDADNVAMIWSPDRSRVAFSSNRKGHLDLYMKAASGTGSEEPLLEDQRDKLPVSWSPDGQRILYVAFGGPSSNDLFVLSLSGDRKPVPFLNTPFSEHSAQFSPDGRWIAYASNESGANEVYVAPFSGQGGKRQISTNGGNDPRWSRNGSELIYVAPDNTLMAAQVDGKGTAFDVGTVTPLFHSLMGFGRYDYAVASDGQQFLIDTIPAETTSTAVTVVLNWTAGLKK
jgi:eukaryotic-like serine/threonine-protein kinase